MNSDMSSWISGIFAAEHEARQGFGQLGLAHAGGSEEDERADRAARVFQTGARPAHRLGDGLDRLFLPDDAACCSSSSIWSRRCDSSSAICITGTPVHMETTSAISSAETTGLLARSQPVRRRSSWRSRSLPGAPGSPGRRRRGRLPAPGRGSGALRAAGCISSLAVLAPGSCTCAPARTIHRSGRWPCPAGSVR